MELNHEKINDVKVISIVGRVDSQTDSFSNDMDEAIEGEQKVLVDCTGMTYINSAGLRVFLSSLKKVTKNDGKFIVSGLNDNITEIFNISGFSSLFSIYGTKDEALKNF
jgi:anti-sigma B factor antagonist